MTKTPRDTSTRDPYATAYAATVDAAPKAFDSSKPAFHIETVKVIREFAHFNFAPDGELTIGAQMDSMITDALERGDEVQELKFFIEPDSWRAMREGFEGQHRARY